MIQTLFIHQDQDLLDHELKKRFKDAAEEAQDIIDLFLSAVHFRNKRHFTRFVYESTVNLEEVMRSIKVYFTMIINNKKMDSSQRTDQLQMQSAAAAGTSCTRNSLGRNKVLEQTVVGLNHDANLIRDKLLKDQKQLDVSVAGMGGLGGFPEDTKFLVRRLIWLWVAEGFIQEDGNQSLEEMQRTT